MTISTWTWMRRVRVREWARLGKERVPHLRRELGQAKGSLWLLVREKRRQALQKVGQVKKKRFILFFSKCLLAATSKKATGRNVKGRGKKVIDSDDEEEEEEEIDMLDDDDE